MLSSAAQSEGERVGREMDWGRKRLQSFLYIQHSPHNALKRIERDGFLDFTIEAKKMRLVAS